MGFLGIYRAVYDYTPQAEHELAISEGDLLYVLEKGDEDDWWKVKKRANSEDDDEPVGLIPNNYIEEAQPIGKARAVYDYTRQTDEELSFPEDAPLEVFDSSDPDWILVGRDGDFGFAPSNYIDILENETEATEESTPPPVLPARPSQPAAAERPTRALPALDAGSTSPAASNAANALAAVMKGRSSQSAAPSLALPPRPTYTSDPSDDEDGPAPALPARSVVQPTPSISRQAVQASPRDAGVEPPFRSPGGFHMYNINEMVSVMGKRKKMPTTLGINLGTGTIMVAPEKAQDGPTQEWTADKMTHYSREGKHVFLELVRPSKSVDFHAGAKDTAEEIVNALDEMAGAVKVTSLKEEFLPGAQAGQKKGQMLYDFMAQGDDEVTVAVGDDVVILDDSLSEEWWKVRRVKNGKEGVVPSSYVEVTAAAVAAATATSPTSHGPSSSKSVVERNRMEEVRLTKEALRASREAVPTSAEVGPGVRLPERGSSLSVREGGNNSAQQRSKRESERSEGSAQSRSSKSKPDPAKVRTWTDRSKSFSVEAQFLGVKDGKLNLHKTNGVKIAVPLAKMSHEDLEYVERMTGHSLDNDKPSDGKKKAKPASSEAASGSSSSQLTGLSLEQPAKPEYDWFQFFLACDVPVGLCERYAQAFIKDSMDESVLPDVDASNLRTLGLREGDIIKVMRYLDNKLGRTAVRNKRNVSFAGDDANSAEGEASGSGGLFSGPGGALRNNTRKGRPAPAVQTNDVVDAKTFSRNDSDRSGNPTSAKVASPRGSKAGGFDDDAWDVKPSKQTAAPEPKPQPEPAKAPEASATTPSQPTSQQLTAGMQELSLLTAPLEPTRAQPLATAAAAQVQPPAPATVSTLATQAQLPGASPSFFAGVAQQQAQPIGVLGLSNGVVNGQLNPQLTARQRPLPPQLPQSQGILVPPPPARPLSAPQVQASAFMPPPALQPQVTGYPSTPQFQTQVALPGQSLSEINQARLQQQYTAQVQQFQPPLGSYQVPLPQGIIPLPTGIQQPYGVGQFGQPVLNGPQVHASLGQFGPLPPQATGIPNAFGGAPGFPPPGSINSYLPPALEPQRIGLSPLPVQQTGIPGFSQGYVGPSAPPPQQAPAPLLPQQTGPPPSVRFGVNPDAKKLVPQATGRRANLAQATPQNPFGF